MVDLWRLHVPMAPGRVLAAGLCMLGLLWPATAPAQPSTRPGAAAGPAAAASSPGAPATAAPAAPHSAQALRAALARLPLDAFADTADGLDDPERRRLVATGQSRAWTLSDAAGPVLWMRSSQGGDEWRLSFLPVDGQTYLMVRARQGRTYQYRYFEPPTVGTAAGTMAGTAAAKSPEPWRDASPPWLVRALQETPDGAPPLALSAVPAAVAEHVRALEACQHWAGEVSDDLSPARKREVVQALATWRCEQRPALERGLRQRHADQPALRALLDRARAMADR